MLFLCNKYSRFLFLHVVFLWFIEMIRLKLKLNTRNGNLTFLCNNFLKLQWYFSFVLDFFSFSFRKSHGKIWRFFKVRNFLRTFFRKVSVHPFKKSRTDGRKKLIYSTPLSMSYFIILDFQKCNIFPGDSQ